MPSARRQLLSGNEAIALAARDAGVALGTGYPGTPSTEILERFSELGGRAAGRNPVLRGQIEFPVLGLGVEPGLMAEPPVVLLALRRGRALCPLAEQAAIGEDAPFAVAARFPAFQRLAVEQRAPTQVRRKRDLPGGSPLGAARQQGLEGHIVEIGVQFVLPGVP